MVKMVLPALGLGTSQHLSPWYSLQGRPQGQRRGAPRAGELRAPIISSLPPSASLWKSEALVPMLLHCGLSVSLLGCEPLQANPAGTHHSLRTRSCAGLEGDQPGFLPQDAHLGLEGQAESLDSGACGCPELGCVSPMSLIAESGSRTL